ncbi:hypothetical protein [Cohaesibacter gelatinilyticus]|uniref:Uncharacterized protein n=1 Tax=Cohaesibacter gelatinilyticus TaxID=372072 RepID=A0A285PNM9_9HYPH|nr:hypothetical protein [Cohaesibacter gelatinilyticus]SNZ21736.1 hypothetical protein SAMN06265368_4861 [Cohaesibacter gelatinilyticus]
MADDKEISDLPEATSVSSTDLLHMSVSGNSRKVKAQNVLANDVVTLAAMEHGTEGDILYYGASGEPSRLTKGTVGQAIKMNASATAPEWSDEVFAKIYDSGELSITAPSETTLSHGLGGMPKLIWAVFVCKVAEYGFSVGDEFIYPLGYASLSAGNGMVAKSDSTQIKIRFIGTSGVYVGRFDSVYQNVTITQASWKLVVRAAL